MAELGVGPLGLVNRFVLALLQLHALRRWQLGDYCLVVLVFGLHNEDLVHESGQTFTEFSVVIVLDLIQIRVEKPVCALESVRLGFLGFVAVVSKQV